MSHTHFCVIGFTITIRATVCGFERSCCPGRRGSVRKCFSRSAHAVLAGSMVWRTGAARSVAIHNHSMHGEAAAAWFSHHTFTMLLAPHRCHFQGPTWATHLAWKRASGTQRNTSDVASTFNGMLEGGAFVPQELNGTKCYPPSS